MKAKRLTANSVVNWGAASLLAASPYTLQFNLTIGCILALIGFAGLTLQAFKMKAYNLVILNCVSSVGYLLTLFGTLL